MTRKAILIMTDSQRWDMVNCYRQTGLRTPNLDALAAQGTRFARAYTTQPVCQPARAAIFTGLYPHSAGSWTNSSGISSTARSIGERLQLDGVHTAYIGKWHLDGGDYFGLGKCPPGWDPDYWYDMKCYLEELPEETRRLTRRTESMWEQDLPSELLYGHRVAARAADFLEKHGQEDFFLAVSFDEPHGPFLCPPPYARMYEDFDFPKGENVLDDLRDKPEHQRVWAQKSAAWDRGGPIRDPAFFGCNSYADELIGRVVRAVDAFAPDALVLYTSDHGEMLHAHGLMSKGPNGYDEITRIPLLIRGPGLPVGAVEENPVSHINLTPTILEWMGCMLPPCLEGPSLLPALRHPGTRVNDCVYLEFGRYEVDHDGFGGFQPLRGVFDGRYKLIVNLLCSDELYDLATDPGEMRNRIEDPTLAAERDRLHDALLRHMNETRDPFRGYYWQRRPWRTDAANCATWDYTGMTRQRQEDPRLEDRQLDYDTGLPMEGATRKK